MEENSTETLILSEYLDKTGLTPLEFSKMADVTKNAVIKWLNNETPEKRLKARKPSWENIEKMEKISKGLLTALSFSDKYIKERKKWLLKKKKS